VEAHREAADGRGVGDDPGLIGSQLSLEWFGRTEHKAEGHQGSDQPEDDQDEDQNWDVSLEHGFRAASNEKGGLRGRVHSKNTGEAGLPPWTPSAHSHVSRR